MALSSPVKHSLPKSLPLDQAPSTSLLSSKLKAQPSNLQHTQDKSLPDNSEVSIIDKDIADILADKIQDIANPAKQVWWENMTDSSLEEKFKIELDMLACKNIECIQGHQGSVLTVAFSLQDSLMMTGGFDSMIRVWDTNSDSCVKVIKEHKGCINSILCNPQTRFFVSASSDSNIILWSLETLIPVSQINTDQSCGVSTIQMNQDGTTLWSSGYDGSVKKWNIEDPKSPSIGKTIFASSSVSNRAINAMILSEDQEELFIAQQDKTIKVINSQQEQVFEVLEGHQMAVKCLDYNNQEKILYSGASDNTIKIWQIAKRTRLSPCLYTIENLPSTVMNIKLSKQGQLLATVMGDVLVYEKGSSGDSLMGAMGHSSLNISSLQNGAHLQSSYQIDTNWVYILKQKIKAHSAEIYNLSLYPDSSLFLTGSMDKELKFWSPDDNYICVKTIEGHSEAIRCIALSPDETILASAGYDYSVKIWGLKNKACLVTLQGHQGCVTALKFQESSELLFSASKDGSIRAWNIKQGVCMHTYFDQNRDSDQAVYSIALFSKKELLASAGKFSDIIVWEMQTKSVKYILRGHHGAVNSLVGSCNEKYLYSAGEDTIIHVWDMKEGKLFHKFGKEEHSKPISCMVLYPNNMSLITGSDDKTIKMWSLDDFTVKSTFSDHKDVVTSIYIPTTKKNSIYSTSLDGYFKIWDLSQQKAITSVGSKDNPLNQVLIDSKEQKAYLAAGDSSIMIFDINEELSETQVSEEMGNVYSLELVPESLASNLGFSSTQNPKNLPSENPELLITSSEDRTIRIWEIPSLVNRQVMSQKQIIYCLKMDSGGTLYGGGETSKIHTLQPFSPEAMSKKNKNNFFDGQHNDIVTCLCMSHDEELLFTGSFKNDHSIRIWGVKTQTMAHEIDAGASVMKLRCSKEGNTLYAGLSNAVVKIYDIMSRTEISTLKGHRGAINDLVLSHTEQYLYTGSADTQIKSWNLADETIMETYPEHTDQVLCLLFARTGQHLFSGGKDNRINIYLTIDGQCIMSLKTRDIDISTMDLKVESQTLYTGGRNHLSAFKFGTFKSIEELDTISLEALRHYMEADSVGEKTKELASFVEALKLKANNYYIQRVNPIMFLANLPYTSILMLALKAFKYPNFLFSYEDDLLYRVLVDEDKRNNHLNTVCDYLLDHPEEIYLHHKTVEEMMKMYSNIKIQRLLTVMFNPSIHGQEGSSLIQKGELLSNPIMRQTSYVDTVPRSLNRDMLANSVSLQEIDYRVTRFPLNMHNGTKFSLLFFMGLSKCQKDVILSDMKHVINYKWLKLKRIILIHAFSFWIMLIFLVLHLAFYDRSVFLFVLSLIFNVGFFVFVCICAKGNVLDYVKRGFNWLDSVLFPYNIVTLSLNMADINFKHFLIAVAISLNMFRGITYLRIFDRTRYLIAMTFRVFTDMISFLTITLFWIITFSFVIFVLRKREYHVELEEIEDEEGRHDFFKIFVMCYTSAMGEFDTQGYVYYDWIVFFVSSIMITMAVFNLLIAIIGDTYSEVKANMVFFDLKEKLEIIADFDNFLHKIRFNKKKNKSFSHMIVSFHPEIEEDQERLQVDFLQTATRQEA